MMASSNGNIFRVAGHLYGKSPVIGELPAQRPVTLSFDVFFDLRLNKRLSKQWWGWWFETPSRSLWRNWNVYIGNPCSQVFMNDTIGINNTINMFIFINEWIFGAPTYIYISEEKADRSFLLYAEIIHIFGNSNQTMGTTMERNLLPMYSTRTWGSRTDVSQVVNGRYRTQIMIWNTPSVLPSVLLVIGINFFILLNTLNDNAAYPAKMKW